LNREGAKGAKEEKRRKEKLFFSPLFFAPFVPSRFKSPLPLPRGGLLATLAGVAGVVG
jgi:hypothetical protein